MINHSIESEDSKHHWLHFIAKEKRILDLGCGRHATDQPHMHSPNYFLDMGADYVVGVDMSQGEIDYYKNLQDTGIMSSEKSLFFCEEIKSPENIMNYIKTYNINAVKCDIEEHETKFYSITSEDLQNVTELAIEYHSLEIRERIIEKIKEWKFDIFCEGKFGFVNAPQMGVLFSRK
jgi:hypothetical protein